METQCFEGFLDLMVAISYEMIDWNESSQKYCLFSTKFLFDNNRAMLNPPENPKEKELVALLNPLYNMISSDDIFRYILAYLPPMTVSVCKLNHPVLTSLIGKTKSAKMFTRDDSCVDVMMVNSSFRDYLQDESKQYSKYLNVDYNGYSYFHHFVSRV